MQEIPSLKNYLIVGLLGLVVALVLGVEPVQRVFNEATQRGTLKGVENFMGYSSSDLLSEEAVRATCVTAFQKPLYRGDHATGRAGPRFEQRRVAWGGNLENKTADHVTTWVKITVSVFDAEGEEQEFVADTSIWIDPLDDAEFLVELPETAPAQFEELDFCDLEDPAPKNCMSWGVTEVKGLSI